MQTNYRKAAVASPYQHKPFTAPTGFDTQEGSPIAESVRLASCAYMLDVKVREDVETRNLFSHIPGVVAFVATLSRNGQPIAVGRSQSVISASNKWVTRTIRMAANGAVIDAVMKAAKCMEALGQDEALERHNATAAEPRPEPSDRYVRASVRRGVDDVATEKQRVFLSRLYAAKIHDSGERQQRINQLGTLTRQEASEQIQAFQ